MIALAAAFAAMYASGLVLLDHEDADAAYQRLHSSNCQSYSHLTGDLRFGSSGLMNFSALPGIAMCPLPSDTALAHRNITTVNVHGYKNTQLDAWVCTKDYNTGSYQCGQLSTSSSGAAFNVSVSDLSALSNNWYGFPWLRLTVGDGSVVYGYYIAGSQ